MEAKRAMETVDTTLGDLVAALSEAAFEVCGNQTVARVLTSLALAELLGRSRLSESDLEELTPESFSGETYH